MFFPPPPQFLALATMCFSRRYLHGEFMFSRLLLLSAALLFAFNLIATARIGVSYFHTKDGEIFYYGADGAFITTLKREQAETHFPPGWGVLVSGFR